MQRIDLRDAQALRSLAAQDFDLIVHSAGLVDLQQAEASPALAWELNVRSVEVLLDALRHTHTKIVYLSTDNVFDGHQGEYTERDGTSPLNVYGRTKVAAENLLAGDRHLAVRIPIVYGRSPFSDRFFARFAGPATPAQTDIVCAPLYLPSLPGALEQLWGESGVVHFGGGEVVTRFVLMSRLRDALNLPTQVVPVENSAMPSGWLRPRHVILRSVRHSLAGPTLETALADLARHSHASAR
jgi:dTDP-4-dehydrorhamnose reductase